MSAGSLPDRQEPAGTRLGAATRPDHSDPRMRGRRYAIPFARVWTGAVTLIQEGRGWTLLETDEQAGRLRAEVQTPVFRFVDDVEVRVRLDIDAQTRVDLISRSRLGRHDLGVNARRIRRYLRALDRRIDADPERTLPPEEGLLPHSTP